MRRLKPPPPSGMRFFEACIARSVLRSLRAEQAGNAEIYWGWLDSHCLQMYMEAGRQSNAREAGDGWFGVWAGSGLANLWICLAFVDSEAGFGYSGVLARCCAWGLCVLTRTRLVNPFERGFTGTGHRLLDAGFGRVQWSQSPSGASPRSPHPNRFVWKWVESRPVHFARAQALCAAVLLRRLAPVEAGRTGLRG